MKQLLIVAHAPSPNTQLMRDAVSEGARQAVSPQRLPVYTLAPLACTAADVLASSAIILGTTENLGYMSGALKDFFDRIYYPCLEQKQGMPYALFVRAGHDGTGTIRAVNTIVTGLRWRAIAEPLLCRGAFDSADLSRLRELGATMATGIEMGVF